MPSLDREGLVQYDLPHPIESYLKVAEENTMAGEDGPGGRSIPRGSGHIECSACGSKCKTDQALRKHERKYHAAKYTCPICSKDFGQRFWVLMILSSHWMKCQLFVYIFE